MQDCSVCLPELSDHLLKGAPSAPAAAPPRRSCQLRSERHIEICECMIDIVAALFNVSSKELRRAGKTATPVSRVRQIAMYVCHVSLGLTMSDIGRGFGRDRTTVMHACHLIEDMRDDIEFERMVGLTERIAVAALRREERN